MENVSDKLWKQAERKIAALIGGQRVPVSGRQRGFSPDIRHNRFSIEVKHREELPGWILDAMNQAEASKTDGQIPIVFLHQKGMSYPNSLTITRLSDMIALQELILDLEQQLANFAQERGEL